jgi:hypothetical protein
MRGMDRIRGLAGAAEAVPFKICISRLKNSAFASVLKGRGFQPPRRGLDSTQTPQGTDDLHVQLRRK